MKYDVHIYLMEDFLILEQVQQCASKYLSGYTSSYKACLI